MTNTRQSPSSLGTEGAVTAKLNAGTDVQKMGTEVQSSDILADAEIMDRSRGWAVLVEDPRGRYRRRVFLTINGAEAACRRAKARGRQAHMALVRVVPVAVMSQ